MNEQECVAYSAPQFSQMTSDEILSYFEKYDFRDEENHRLVLCDDFIALVNHISVLE